MQEDKFEWMNGAFPDGFLIMYSNEADKKLRLACSHKQKPILILFAELFKIIFALCEAYSEKRNN